MPDSESNIDQKQNPKARSDHHGYTNEGVKAVNIEGQRTQKCTQTPFDTPIDIHSIPSNSYDNKQPTPKMNEKNMNLHSWLINECNLPQYYEMFLMNGYDSCDIMKAIQPQSELQEIGITSELHQAIIMAEIALL